MRTVSSRWGNIYPSGELIASRYEIVQGPNEKPSLAGGMGLVYLCLDKQDQRPVVLKTFQPKYLSNRPVRDRFLREGTAWLNLEFHPHIVRCYDVINLERGLETFLVLELVTEDLGKQDASLKSWLKFGKALPAEQAVAFSIQIARGMKYACKKIPSFVHRDLNPSNILIGVDKLPNWGINHLRITDFGLATVAESINNLQDIQALERLDLLNAQDNLTDGIIGTRLYMAPEQWLGEKVGMYTDIYALGLILIEMISGKAATINEPLVAVREAHITGSICGLPAGSLQQISEIVASCVATKVQERYQSWEDLEQALVEAYQTLTQQICPNLLTQNEFNQLDQVRNGWSLCSIGSSYIEISKFDTAINYFKQVIDMGQKQGEVLLRAVGLSHLGIAHKNKGELQLAIKYFQETLEIYRGVRNQYGEGHAHGNLGDAYRFIGKNREAIKLLEQAVQIMRNLGDRSSEGKYVGSLAEAYRGLGKYQQAIDYQTESIEIMDTIGDQKGKGRALGNLGIVYAQLGKFPQAITYFKEFLKIARDVGDRQGESNALGSLGAAYSDQRDFQLAMEYSEMQLELAHETGDLNGIGIAYGNLAVANENLGNYQAAASYYEKSLEIVCSIGDRKGEAETIYNLALLNTKQGNNSRALHLAEQAINMFKQLGHWEFANRAQQLISYIKGKHQ